MEINGENVKLWDESKIHTLFVRRSSSLNPEILITSFIRFNYKRFWVIKNDGYIVDKNGIFLNETHNYNDDDFLWEDLNEAYKFAIDTLC